MNLRSVVLLGAGIAGFGLAYSWLAGELFGWSTLLFRVGPWLQRQVGVPHGIMLWTEVLNTAATAIAALAVSIGARNLFGRRALLVVIVAAAVVVAYEAAVEIRVSGSIQVPRPGLILITAVLDDFKMAVLPALALWVVGGWPSNVRWSGP